MNEDPTMVASLARTKAVNAAFSDHESFIRAMQAMAQKRASAAYLLGMTALGDGLLSDAVELGESFEALKRAYHEQVVGYVDDSMRSMGETLRAFAQAGTKAA